MAGLGRRLAWFLGLWLGGVLSVAALAYLIRLGMGMGLG